ncbi:hypothetical protein [Caulobacter sp. 17J80-11]|nr:hypothetical protein [Caulobacter sp. 17J80-11]
MWDGLDQIFRADGAAIMAAGAALVALLFLASRGARPPRRR